MYFNYCEYLTEHKKAYRIRGFKVGLHTRNKRTKSSYQGSQGGAKATKMDTIFLADVKEGTTCCGINPQCTGKSKG